MILGYITVEVHELKKRMENFKLKRPQSPDGISNWVLKECRGQLADNIHIVLHDSIKEGKAPQDWKWASIGPIYKKGNKKDSTNYRSVSLISEVEKF